MPNHTSTILTIKGPKAEIQRFIEAAKGEKGALDFNSLYPMPAELRGTSSPVRIQTQEEIDKTWAEWKKRKENKADSGPMGLHDFEKDRPFGLGITAEENERLLKTYGFNNWFDFAVNCWGTKWGAYDVGQWEVKDGQASIFYQTAWSPATPFFEKVSLDFPDLTFKHEFADEGGGFLGWEVIKEGEITENVELDWNSDSGKELRQKLGVWYDDEETEEEGE